MTAAERAQRRAELRDAYRQRKARELERHGEDELAAEVLDGRCACGCHRPLDASTVRGFYIDVRHRQRAHRRRLERAAKAAGVPARLSLESLQATADARDRNGDAPARPRRPRHKREGVSVYFPTVRELERLESAVAGAVNGAPLDGEDVIAGLEAIAKALARRRAK